MTRKIGEVVTVKDPNIRNQVGGTVSLKGDFHARIEKTWGDYEIGQRYIGVLEDEAEIEMARIAGLSAYTPEHYKQYGEKMFQETKDAFDNYKPQIVYFGDSNLQ